MDRAKSSPCRPRPKGWAQVGVAGPEPIPDCNGINSVPGGAIANIAIIIPIINTNEIMKTGDFNNSIPTDFQ